MGSLAKALVATTSPVLLFTYTSTAPHFAYAATLLTVGIPQAMPVAGSSALTPRWSASKAASVILKAIGDETTIIAPILELIAETPKDRRSAQDGTQLEARIVYGSEGIYSVSPTRNLSRAHYRAGFLGGLDRILTNLSY
jgi:hypothetical protein